MKKLGICAVYTLTEEACSLKAITEKRPIAALPFASRYRLIDFALSNASEASIDSLALFIGKSGRSIYDHIRNGKPWDLDSHISGGIFTFSQQFYKYSLGAELGFDRSFYENLVTFVKRSKTSHVFISGSQILATLDIKDIRDKHIDSGKDITSVFSSQLGQVMNMYIVSVDFLMTLIDRAVEEDMYIEADDLIRHYLKYYEINTYVHQGYTANINSDRSYYQANMDMLDGDKFDGLFNNGVPIVTKEKHGAPTFYTGTAKVSTSLLATDCVIRGTVEHSLIFRRVDILEGATVKHSIIMQGSRIEEGAHVEYAILDKGVQVKAGQVIKGTPENIAIITKDTVLEMSY